MKDMNALLLGRAKQVQGIFPWTICSYSHCTSNMRCYHGNQMVNKLQLHSSWKWLQTYWVSVGWGQRQRIRCHDNQGGRWGEMPWLNQEWCQSPTECKQLVSSCLFVVAIVVVYLELIFKSVCSLQLRGQDAHWYIHTWEITMEIIYLQRRNVASGFVFSSLTPVYVTCITKVGKNLVTFSDVPRH